MKRQCETQQPCVSQSTNILALFRRNFPHDLVTRFHLDSLSSPFKNIKPSGISYLLEAFIVNVSCRFWLEALGFNSGIVFWSTRTSLLPILVSWAGRIEIFLGGGPFRRPCVKRWKQFGVLPLLKSAFMSRVLQVLVNFEKYLSPLAFVNSSYCSSVGHQKALSKSAGKSYVIPDSRQGMGLGGDFFGVKKSVTSATVVV